MAIGTTLKIGFDSTKVKTGLSGIKSSFQSIAKVGLGIAKVGSAIIGVGVAAGVAFTSIVIKLNGIGEAARTSEDRIRNIVEQMGLFGKEASTVSDRLIELSKTTARQIGVDEKVIQSTQAKLATFAELAESADEIGGAFDRATMAAVDMAAAGFGSAEENAVQLGKALNDPIKGITALSRSGVTFTEKEKEKIRVLVESGKQLKAQDMILKAIEKQVGGTAEATANSSDKIKTSFGQIVDAFAMPFSEGFDALPDALEGTFTKITDKATQLGRDVGTAISEAVNGDKDRLLAIGEFIGTAIGGGMKNILKNNYNDLGLLMNVRHNYITGKTHPDDVETLEYNRKLLRESTNEGLMDELLDIYNTRIKTKPPIKTGSTGSSSIMLGSSDGVTGAFGGKEVLDKIEKNTRTGSKM